MIAMFATWHGSEKTPKATSLIDYVTGDGRMWCVATWQGLENRVQVMALMTYLMESKGHFGPH